MNLLPNFVQEEIDALVFGISQQTLSSWAETLTRRYTAPHPSSLRLSEGEHLAYLAYRMPATYAVVLEVLEYVNQVAQGFRPQSFLDAGSGPGTAALAALQYYPSITKGIILERNPLFLKWNQNFLKKFCLHNEGNVPHLEWIHEDLSHVPLPLENEMLCDLVLASYVLGELQDTHFLSIIDALAERTQGLLVLIEPGTPAGYNNIIKARSHLVEKGFSIVAPCPQNERCPIKKGDWCHFSCRLSRSRLHRKTKRASLGYEDEKFSYVALSKIPEYANKGIDRIIRDPERGPRTIELTLCTKESAIHTNMVSKNDGDYQAAKKLRWGDLFSPN